MSVFYEIIIRVPFDVEEHLPGIPDSFVEWITGQGWELPEESDLDLTLIEQPQLTVADRIRRVFLYEWNKLSKQDAKFFVQFEKGKEYFHLHTLVEPSGIASMILGRYVSQIRAQLVRVVFQGIEPRIDDWIAITKVKKGGANKVVDTGYIPAYLLPKVQPELQWAWTNLEEYKLATLNLEERRRIVAEFLTASSQRSQEEAASESAFSEDPVIKSKASQRYMALVNWLVEHGITSERQWIQENQESYLSFNSTGNSRNQIKAALDNATKIMSLTKSAADYLVGSFVPEDITKNRIWQIFDANGYDPAYAGSILYGWCKRSFNKRNTVWLYGPATTGKTNIAEAIAHSVPFYGCVNWTNENFPFNDCVDKMLIWWEEGKMTNKVVESAKAILGGSRVRVDQKCKASAQIDATPVIVTSNTNMCIVVDGNSTTFEHQQPLEDRMFKFELTRRLPPDFGKITKREVKDFFAWAEANLVPVTHEFRVPKGAETSLKRPLGDVTDTNYKSPEKRRRVSFDPETPDCSDETADPAPPRPIDWTSRYDCRCDTHARVEEVSDMCEECEYLNRGKNGCIPHKMNYCQICHDVPPWLKEKVSDVVDMDDANKEQ